MQSEKLIPWCFFIAIFFLLSDLTVGSFGLHVIDISDPTTPTLAGFYNTPGDATGVFVSGDRACVADGDSGLQVINISDPTTPTLAGAYDTAGVLAGVYVSGDHAFMADGSSGHVVIRIGQGDVRADLNIGQSIPVDSGDGVITQVRLTTTQTQSVDWELSTDGGSNWGMVTPGSGWAPVTPGTDLIWRSTHTWDTPGVNPGVSQLDDYARRGHRKVRGWLDAGAIALVTALDAIQKERGIAGHVGEIGVHHGRFFLLLLLLARTDERAVAIDIFELQDRNVDHSGQGDREMFERNVRTHAGGLDRVEVLTRDSQELGPADIEAAVGGKVRLFSVDGGHTAEATQHDLTIAAAALAEGGIVVLDDYFNESWPGVSEGTNRFFHDDPDTPLAPVAIGGNKICLASSAGHAAAYRETLVAVEIGAEHKVSELFGHPVICYDFTPPDLSHRLADTAAWEMVRGTRFGQALKRFAKRHW